MLSAAVVQSANDALSNDIMVSHPKNTKSIQAKKKINIKTQSDKKNKNNSVIDSSEKQNNVMPKQQNIQKKTSSTKDPNAGYGYTQKYASKLFKAYSGYITIEQENIPRKLNIVKGSSIQFNLTEIPDAIWNVDVDEKIAQIVSNKVEKDKRIVVIKLISSGNCRLFLDNISIKDNKYRVIFNKKMSLLVEEE